MSIKISFGHKKNAGLVRISFGDIFIHFLVSKRHWMWWRHTEEYDSCLEYFGLGPILLVCWVPRIH